MGDILRQKENRLVAAFKSNDQKLMGEVYQVTFPKVKSHILKNSGDADQAKDVFQEAFVACWRNIKADKFSSDGNVEAYLYTIAKNKWTDFLRSSNYKKTVSSNTLGHLQLVSEEIKSDDEVRLEQNRTTMLRALERLGEQCKNLLRLFYYERNSMDEISKIMELTPASARNQKYRCMEKLRNLSMHLKENGQ